MGIQKLSFICFENIISAPTSHVLFKKKKNLRVVGCLRGEEGGIDLLLCVCVCVYLHTRKRKREVIYFVKGYLGVCICRVVVVVVVVYTIYILYTIYVLFIYLYIPPIPKKSSSN